VKKYLALSLGLLCFGVSPSLAGSHYHAPSVIGKKSRSQIRHFLYAKNLKHDKKVVFDQYGYSAHRVRQNVGGTITETWQYPEHGKEFTFNVKGHLIGEREITVVNGRSWVYQK